MRRAQLLDPRRRALLALKLEAQGTGPLDDSSDVEECDFCEDVDDKK